jgi:RsiW-degrading membrane proteinase PrsW (M82 family)
MPFFFAALAAIVPTGAYVALIWRLDRYEKEPLGIIAAAFIWGAVPAVLGAIIAELVLGLPVKAFVAEQSALINASLVAPPVEEGLKALALLAIFVIRRAEFDDILDGIIYGSLVGLGFSMTENLLYFVSASPADGWAGWGPLILGRAGVFGFNHAMFTALTGIGLGLARYARSTGRRAAWFGLGLAAAIVAHLLHNLLLSFEGLCYWSVAVDWAGVLAVVGILLLTWRREHGWLKVELAAEVATGVLTVAEYQQLVSPSRRLRRAWRLQGSAGRRAARTWQRFADVAAELAFKKHQQSALGIEKGGPAAIVALRARLAQLRAQLAGYGEASVVSGDGTPEGG